MRRLILFRHAKSDWSDPLRADHDRNLAPRGVRAAGPMGAWLAGRGFRPDRVICSTAVRAQETWALAKSAFAPEPETILNAALYDARPETLIEIVRRTPDFVQTLMLVGHNPGLEGFVELAMGAADPEARRALLNKFPTAALAALETPYDAWSTFGPKSARLDRFVTPRSLGIDAE